MKAFDVMLVLFVLFVLSRPHRWQSTWRKIRYRHSDSWRMVQARIESHEIRRFNTESGTSYQPCLSYSYNLEDEFFSGEYYGNLYRLEDAAQFFLDQHPVDSVVTVRVNPNNFAKSVLFLDEENLVYEKPSRRAGLFSA